MKQITAEEKAKFVTHPMGKQSLARIMLMNMMINDILLIETADWKWKSATPAFLCRRIEKETDRKFEVEKVLQPKTGWIITRVK